MVFFLPREAWVDGPWSTEPDELPVWRDDATGLHCVARRSHAGQWCGYVGVASDHPAYGQPAPDGIDVHGGVLSTARLCTKCAQREPSLHDVWWFGFDCGVFDFDLCPVFASVGLFPGVYRDLTYVKDQITRLAQQFAAIGGAVH